MELNLLKAMKEKWPLIYIANPYTLNETQTTNYRFHMTDEEETVVSQELNIGQQRKLPLYLESIGKKGSDNICTYSLLFKVPLDEGNALTLKLFTFNINKCVSDSLYKLTCPFCGSDNIYNNYPYESCNDCYSDLYLSFESVRSILRNTLLIAELQTT